MSFTIQLVNIFLKFKEELIVWLKNSESIPTIIQNTGLALLTILIPLAIAVLEDINLKQKDKKRLLGGLDLHVILDHVFQMPKLLVWTTFIFLPLLLWDIFISLPLLRLLLIFFSCIGIYFIGKTVLKGYLWVKGRVWDFRFSYLDSLKEHKDFENVWRSVWQTEIINREDIEVPNSNDEQKFFNIFSKQIDKLLQQKKDRDKNELKLISNLLNDFLRFVDYRSIFFLTFNCLPKILEWHFKIWEKKYKYLTKKDKLDKQSSYSEIYGTLDSFLKKIEERAFKEGESFSFFETFKKHAEKYKWQFVESEDKSKKYYYIESLFSIFYQVFFEVIEGSPERYDIWEHYFPREWKITKNNLTSEENVISQISLNNFLDWARKRIWQPKEDFDRSLDDAVYNLFPEVEPILWARILIFVFSFRDPKSAIERPWNFGFIGRIRSYFGYPGNNKEEFRRKMREMRSSAEKIEINNTFELAYLLFSDQFSKENLEKYISNLKELKYGKESIEEDKRLQLLSTFGEMLKYKSGA